MKTYYLSMLLITLLSAGFLTVSCGLKPSTSPKSAPAATFTPTFTATATPVTKVNIVSEADFTSVVLNSKVPVMVDCSATWCPACVDFAPTALQFAKDYQGKILVVELDCTTYNATAQATYGVTLIPTSLFFEGGKLKNSVVGDVSESTLSSTLSSI